MIVALILLALLLAVGTLLKLTHKPDPAGEPAAEAPRPDECCGRHEVCERDTLLVYDNVAEYFDDEELDRYAGTGAGEYDEKAVEEFRDVLLTLRPDEVPAWARSLNVRGITLPEAVRDELLLLVAENRNT